jgi:hypothetical protein
MKIFKFFFAGINCFLLYYLLKNAFHTHYFIAIGGSIYFAYLTYIK